MKSELVFTVLGEDRPGLVEKLAARVAAHDGSWMESSMSRLGGQFAGIVRISIPEAMAGRLENALMELEASDNLAISLHASPGESRGGKERTATLALVGHDQKGIVLRVTSELARLGVNVEELETGVKPASMDGNPMFSARAKVYFPKNVSPRQVQEALEAIAGDIMVDISFEVA